MHYTTKMFLQVRSVRSALALGAALGARTRSALLSAQPALLWGLPQPRASHTRSPNFQTRSTLAVRVCHSLASYLSTRPTHTGTEIESALEPSPAAPSSPSQHPTSRRKQGKRFFFSVRARRVRNIPRVCEKEANDWYADRHMTIDHSTSTPT